MVQYQKPAFSVSVCLTPHSRWTILHVTVTLMFYRWTSHVIWLSNVAEKPAPKVPNISLSFNESINAHARLGDSELGWKLKLPLHVCLSLNDRCFWKRGYLTFLADAYERSRFATKQKKAPRHCCIFPSGAPLRLLRVKLLPKQRVSKKEGAPARVSIDGMFWAENKENKNCICTLINKLDIITECWK